MKKRGLQHNAHHYGSGAGDIDGGIWSAGQSQALIHDIPTCAELISRIVAEAETIIAGRLQRMVVARAAVAAE